MYVCLPQLTGKWCLVSFHLRCSAWLYILRLAITDNSPGFFLKDDLTLNDLQFADDIAALTQSLKENTVLCQQIADIAAKYGILFNIRKTQYMTINIPRPRNFDDQVYVNGAPLEEVHDFKYLGAYIGSTAHDIKVRKGMTWRAMESLDVFKWLIYYFI